MFDIDHLSPLAEAWDSGAWAWDADTRMRYADDLDDPRSLIAVSASANRSKGDQDPAEWMPPAASYACTYITDWVAVKTRWGTERRPRREAGPDPRRLGLPERAGDGDASGRTPPRA
jgi:hypothetical protein